MILSLKKTETGFNFLSRLGNLGLPKPNLLGDHQIINASSVIASILLLGGKFNISAENIAEGISSASWQGRLQEFNISPIINKPHSAKCWLDGAHNISGADAIADWARQQKFENLVLIIGLTKNRDILSFLSPFLELNPKIYSVRVKSEASSYPAEVIAEKAKEIGICVTPCDEIEEALTNAVNHNQHARIVITGSLFLVSDCLKLLL